MARSAPEAASQLPELPQIVAFRNLLIHGYAMADDALAWRTVTRELPALRARLKAMLGEA